MLRSTPLSREEKQELGQLLAKLKIVPPVAGCVGINFDGQLQVASVELQRIVWR